MTALRPCPVCSAADVEPIYRQDFVIAADHPLAEGYTVVACNTCGFVYADVSASQKDYDIYYARMSKYEDDHTATGAGLTPWDNARLDATAELIASSLPSPNARILDVGCANGGLLVALRNRGFRNLTGIDPSPACATATNSKGIEARTGSVFSLPADLGSFDCIVFSHVFEHILDLQNCLNNLSSSFLYLEVPDASRYASCIHAPFQDFNTEHINHFSMQCLRNLVGRHGYIPVLESARDMNLSRQTSMPVIAAMYRGTDSIIDLVKDSAFVQQIREYIRLSTDLMRIVEAELTRQIGGHEEVVLWGTGQLAMKLLDRTLLKNLKIVACIDGNPIHHGKSFAGAKIYPPSELPRFSQPVVIASLIHDREIAEGIRAMGIANRTIHLAPGLPLPYRPAL